MKLIAGFGAKQTGIEEDIAAVNDVSGENTLINGFKPYGEIYPFSTHTICELHNQTMTITTFDEI